MVRGPADIRARDDPQDADSSVGLRHINHWAMRDTKGCGGYLSGASRSPFSTLIWRFGGPTHWCDELRHRPSLSDTLGEWGGT